MWTFDKIISSTKLTKMRVVNVLHRQKKKNETKQLKD